MSICIPSSTMRQIERYVVDHVPPGGFVAAVLSNDLKNAVGRADGRNRECIPDIVSHLYNNVPATCWGSVENYKAWIGEK